MIPLIQDGFISKKTNSGKEWIFNEITLKSDMINNVHYDEVVPARKVSNKIQEGMYIEGWRVDKVFPYQVRLTHGSRVKYVSLGELVQMKVENVSDDPEFVDHEERKRRIIEYQEMVEQEKKSNKIMGMEVNTNVNSQV